MSLRIKILAPIIILGLALTALFVDRALHAHADLTSARAQRDAGLIGAALSEAAVALAVERGTMNGILANPATATPERRGDAARAGAAGEASVETALARLAQTPALAQGQGVPAAVAALVEARAAVVALRTAAAPGGATPPAPAAWFAATTTQIDRVLGLQRALDAAATGSANIEERLAGLRQQLGETAEQGGRERGLVNGIVAAGRVPTPEEARRIGGFIARSGLALDRAAAVAEGLPAPVPEALATARRTWAEQAGRVREGVLAAADAARPYPLSPAEWFGAMTRAIDAVVAAQRSVSATLDAQLAAREAGAQRMLFGTVAALVVALGVVLAATLLVQRGVVRPLRGAVMVLDRVAGGDLDLPVTLRRAAGSRGADEVDALLQAAESLRLVSIDARAADAAAAEMKLEAERERGRTLRDVAARVDSAVRSAVGDVAGRMHRLQESTAAASANASDIARSGAESATIAARSLEDAQSVAAATTELSASVSEIARQVQTTAEAARQAAAESDRSSAVIHDLSETVGRIGGAAALIAEIAGRTNLLALNATIEAARAGDAGKGFAIVAGEVKALAAQTARATEEIRQQIGAVTGAAGDAVLVVQGIATAVARVDEAATAIAAAVEEQAQTTREIAEVIARTADGTRSVAGSIAVVADGAREAERRIVTMRTEAEGATMVVEDMARDLGRILHGSAPELDRRAEPRVTVPGLRARIGDGAAAVEGDVIDIAPSGIAVRATLKAEPGTRVMLTLPGTDIGESSFEVIRAGDGVLRGRLIPIDGTAAQRLQALCAAQGTAAAAA